MNFDPVIRVIKASVPYVTAFGVVVSIISAAINKPTSLFDFIFTTSAQFASLFLIFYVVMLTYWQVSGSPFPMAKIIPSSLAVSIFVAAASLGFARSKGQFGFGLSILMILLISLVCFLVLLIVSYLAPRFLLWFLSFFGWSR